jgi:hypothetical protein
VAAPDAAAAVGRGPCVGSGSRVGGCAAGCPEVGAGAPGALVGAPAAPPAGAAGGVGAQAATMGRSKQANSKKTIARDPRGTAPSGRCRRVVTVSVPCAGGRVNESGCQVSDGGYWGCCPYRERERARPWANGLARGVYPERSEWARGTDRRRAVPVPQNPKPNAYGYACTASDGAWNMYSFK